jgi:hypothetical protein
VHPTADAQRFRCEKDILADHRRLAEHEVASLAFKVRQREDVVCVEKPVSDPLFSSGRPETVAIVNDIRARPLRVRSQPILP